MKNIINFVKGIFIGIATIIPGTSGGTMSIILGVYDKLVHAVSSFLKDIKGNIIFLGTIALGGLVGIGIFSRFIEYGVSNFRQPVICFFLGGIVGGIPVIYKRTDTKTKKGYEWLYFVMGFILIAFMSLFKLAIVDLAVSTGILNFIFLIIAGIITAVALILPGISSAFMLMSLGLYDITIKAINDMQFNYLIPIALGAAIGVITTTRILESLMNNKPRPTFMLILGFVLGSVIEVLKELNFSSANLTPYNIIASILTFIFGIVLIRTISKKYSE